MVRVPRRIFQRLLPERPTPERCLEAYYLQRTRFESIAERKLRRRQLSEDGNVEISGRDLRPNRHLPAAGDALRLLGAELEPGHYRPCRHHLQRLDNLAATRSLIKPNKEQGMPASARDMITTAERRFPVRIRVGIPPEGLGRRRLTEMTAWLDQNCGTERWAITPSGMRGVLNDALSIYFADATLASAFVARWCVGYKVETAEGVFRFRGDEPTPRVTATMHRAP